MKIIFSLCSYCALPPSLTRRWWGSQSQRGDFLGGVEPNVFKFGGCSLSHHAPQVFVSGRVILCQYGRFLWLGTAVF